MAKLEIDLQPEEQSLLESRAQAAGMSIVEYARGKLLDGGSPAESAWDVLDRLTGTIDGPVDWSEEHDHYLYGTPKRGAKNHDH